MGGGNGLFHLIHSTAGHFCDHFAGGRVGNIHPLGSLGFLPDTVYTILLSFYSHGKNPPENFKIQFRFSELYFYYKECGMKMSSGAGVENRRGESVKMTKAATETL
jgi:hypothetical protein